MRSMFSTWAIGLAAATTLALGGCATTVPDELEQARQAYIEAESGPAAQVAPAELLEARQTLEWADRAFEEEGDEQIVRDKAYIAHRKVEVAKAIAQTRLYEEQLSQANLRKQQLAGEVSERLQKSQQAFGEQSEDLEQERQARIQAEAESQRAIQSLKEFADVRNEERGLVVSLASGFMFGTGEANVRPQASQRLSAVARLLQSSPDRKVIVEGHTDSQGSDSMNMELSRERAESVRQFLVQQGIPADRIQTEALGESRPIASNDDATGRAQNRRVEIVLQPLPTKQMGTPEKGQQGPGQGTDQPIPSEQWNQP